VRYQEYDGGSRRRRDFYCMVTTEPRPPQRCVATRVRRHSSSPLLHGV